MAITTTEKLLVKKLIEQGLTQEINGEWQIQGFGMLRLYITKEVRLHVWHNGLVYHDTPSQIHNHPWNFNSRIVVGNLRNVRYLEWPEKTATHHIAKILCGPGGGLTSESPRDTNLEIATIDEYNAGDVYYQTAKELHRTVFKNGTVTIVTREFLDDADHALVAYPIKQQWKTAEPRTATERELELGLKAALDLF